MICKAAMQEAKAIKPIQSNENPLEIDWCSLRLIPYQNRYNEVQFENVMHTYSV